MSSTVEIERLLDHAGWLRRLAGGLVSDPLAADDLVQETWIAALRRPPERAAALRPWLARVVRNLARNARRDAGRRSAHESALEPRPPAPTPEALAQDAEMQRVLAEAVTALAEPLRSVVVLRYFHGLDSAAIARELGLPGSTVRSRLQKALADLRAELDRRHSGGRGAWSALAGAFARRGELLGGATLAAGSASAVWTAGWIAALGGTALLAAAGTAVWKRGAVETGVGATSPRSERLASVEADARRAPTPPTSERTEVEPSAASSASRGGAGIVPDEIELAGTILVDGRPAEWPVELELRPMERAGSSPARSRLEWRKLVRGRLQHLTTTSERPGHFSFGKLPATWSGRLKVFDATFDDGQTSLPLASPRPGLILHLRSGPTLAGRLVDREGEPVAPARFAYELRKDHDDPNLGEVEWKVSVEGDDDRATLVSSAHGRFRIPLSPSGRSVTATILVEDEQGYLRHEIPAFAPADGFDAGDLVLEPVRTLEFRVVDREGRPIRGAIARVEGPDWARRSEPTGAEGAGELRFVPERRGELRFSAFRYADRVVAVGSTGALEVALERLATLEIQLTGPEEVRDSQEDIVLTAQSSLFVWDNAWGADAELQIELGASQPQRRRRDGDWFQAEFRPRADDRFLFVGLRPGVTFEIDVRDRSGHSLAVRSLALAPHEQARLEIQVGP